MLATVLHPTSLHSVRKLSLRCVCCENNAQQGVDFEVVSSQDDLKQHLLINGDKLSVPFTNIGRSLSVLIRVGLISSR